MNNEDIDDELHKSEELSYFAQNYNLKNSHKDTKSLSSVSKYADKDGASIKIVNENLNEDTKQNLEIPSKINQDDISDFNAADDEYEILEVNTINNYPVQFDEIKELEIINKNSIEQDDGNIANISVNRSSKEERLSNDHNSEGMARVEYSNHHRSLSSNSNKLKSSINNMELGDSYFNKEASEVLLDKDTQEYKVEDNKVESPISQEITSPKAEDSPGFEAFEEDDEFGSKDSPPAIKPVLIETPEKQEVFEETEQNNLNEVSPYAVRFGEERKSKSMFNLPSPYSQSKFRQRENSPFRDLNTIRENDNISENEDESVDKLVDEIPSENESDLKSQFSSRNSFLDKEYKVKVNDHESFDVVRNKSK